MTKRDRNARSRNSAQQTSGSNEAQTEIHGEELPAPSRPSPQMWQDNPGFSQGSHRSSSQQGAGASSPPGGRQLGRGGGDSAEELAENHAGQLGYSQGGGAHDNWGAFDGDQQRQSPGYGQDEPWQHHQDADYLRWREEHLRLLDEEYAIWRRDRYGKFSEEFSQWRDSRQGKPGEAASSPQRGPEIDDKLDSKDRRTSLHGKLK